ncbi:MAG: DUF2442 domain-containing protein [Anaerolineae bacterium]|nr:DUF2442 domain-containing protein [Anaerolineae bacterium]MCO5190126.1 DUF2442 domain-containing protein [Anaerolineae bacterium]MCO5194879.1 DUF2442 domain-containing protein [Anaerolineae bacterium]MCO5199864.1 DUF2442 domain-containing protein [Anaerolineae bacterium]MCO5207616.1 DUF2442 domain-containing protein [Anaerolineae bacterium]
MSTFPDNVKESVSASHVSFADNTLHITLSDGRVISVPLARVDWLNWLMQATPQQRANWSIEPGGYAVYWEDLDDGIEIAHLLSMQPLA